MWINYFLFWLMFMNGKAKIGVAQKCWTDEAHLGLTNSYNLLAAADAGSFNNSVAGQQVFHLILFSFVVVPLVH